MDGPRAARAAALGPHVRGDDRAVVAARAGGRACRASARCCARGSSGSTRMPCSSRASSNPDNLVLPLWTAALLGGTLLLVRGLTWPRLLAFLLPVLALPLRQADAASCILPAALLVLGVAVRRRHGDRGWRSRSPRSARLLALGVGAGAARRGSWPLRRWRSPSPCGTCRATSCSSTRRSCGRSTSSRGGRSTRLIAIHRDVAASLAPAVLALLTLAAVVWLFRLARVGAAAPCSLFYGLAAVGLVAGLHWVAYVHAQSIYDRVFSPAAVLPAAGTAGRARCWAPRPRDCPSGRARPRSRRCWRCAPVGRSRGC